MIGHYLLTLSEAQEDRVLTRPFGGMFEKRFGTCKCLVWTALGRSSLSWVGRDMESAQPWRDAFFGPAYVFEDLAERFGDLRIQSAIRNRILANRLWRTLGNRPASLRATSWETAGVDTQTVGECRFGRGE